MILTSEAEIVAVFFFLQDAREEPPVKKLPECSASTIQRGAV